MAKPRLDRDDPFYDYIPANPVIDERTKAAGMAAAKAAAPAAAKTIAKSSDQLMLEQAQALLAKQKTTLSELYVSQGLNPDGSKKTNTQVLQEKQATTAAARATLESEDPLFNKAAGAPAAPAGYKYTWIGGTTTGSWKLYKLDGSSADGATGGNGGVGGSSTSTATTDNKPKEISDATRDAFAALTDLFASYGLESLAGEIAGYMTQGLTAAEALIKLKTNPTGAYAKRFAGNFTRIKNGLNAISEAAYVGLENSYASTLKAYGLGNMVSINRDDNYKKFADYIAGDISADEFKDRVNTVVARVQNSDPGIKATLKAFYPEITDNDLVSYFLSPKENLPKLQEKVTASEIGAAATGMGLTTNVGTATDLAKYGVDQKMAREGYSTIADVLPTATKLGDIYNQAGIKYGQAEGEAEVFKGSQDAATKRKRLASMERAAFSGSSGTGQSSLTRSTQGRL
jgi:hypothetical protein